MIAIIRIVGKVGVNYKIEETLSRLRLRKKYACSIWNESKELEGMLEKVGDFVAYGKIDEKMLKQLVEKRGQKIDKKKKVGEVKNLNLKEANLKPFFRLHPPRGGLGSSKHRYPAGVLGSHGDKLNELLERML